MNSKQIYCSFDLIYGVGINSIPFYSLFHPSRFIFRSETDIGLTQYMDVISIG